MIRFRLNRSGSGWWLVLALHRTDTLAGFQRTMRDKYPYYQVWFFGFNVYIWRGFSEIIECWVCKKYNTRESALKNNYCCSQCSAQIDDDGQQDEVYD